MGYLVKNIVIVIGLVLIWRGIWVLLDLLDYWLFGGSHIATAVIGIIVGFAFIYFPEKNLEILERL